MLIELNGDSATAECYVWAYHVAVDDVVEKEGILGGRHLFKMARRDDAWRIVHCTTVFDWNQNQNATAIWSDNYSDDYRGFCDKTDASYQYLK